MLVVVVPVLEVSVVTLQPVVAVVAKSLKTLLRQSYLEPC